MKKTAVFTLIVVAAACPAMGNCFAKPYAKPHHVYQHALHGYQNSHYARQTVHRSYPNFRHADRDVRRAGEPAGNLADHSHITCEMVRGYVAQVGLEQAKAMATAAGMTASEERRARQCLASRT